MYKKVLLAVDLLSDEKNQVIPKAVSIAKEHQAELVLLYVIELLPAYYAADYIISVEAEEELPNRAKTLMRELAQQLEVPEERQIIKVGKPAKEVCQLAKDQNVDLIVVGRHGFSRMGALLGSIANSVLHHADCDVLAVRIFSAKD